MDSNNLYKPREIWFFMLNRKIRAEAALENAWKQFNSSCEEQNIENFMKAICLYKKISSDRIYLKLSEMRKKYDTDFYNRLKEELSWNGK